MPLKVVLQHLYKPELFRLSWGAKNTQGEEWEKLSAEFEERLARMSRDMIRNGWLKPQAVYGYFPANADGDDLIVYDPRSCTASMATKWKWRASASRARTAANSCASAIISARCIAARRTWWHFRSSPWAQEATRRFDTLQANDQYSEAYFFHGLAVQSAEATAQYVNMHVRRELGIPAERGKRYSWGYPACPDLDDHQIVLRLLPEAATKLGMTLTTAFQWVPEQSTAAIFAHHPAAKYYAVGAGRLEQLTSG